MGDFRDEQTGDLPLVPPNEVVGRVRPTEPPAAQAADEDDLHDGWQPVRKRTSRPPGGD